MDITHVFSPSQYAEISYESCQLVLGVIKGAVHENHHNLAQKGLIALLVFMTLIVLVTWLFKFDDSSPYNARAQTIVNAAVVVTSTGPVIPVSATLNQAILVLLLRQLVVS